VCNKQHSTLGFMTAGLLKESGLGNAVRANVAVEVPTADFLINQMRAGGLDAAIVYLVNVLPQTEHLEAIKLPETKGRAVQPFAVRQGSPNALAAGRLLTFLQAHREAFEKAGFSWRGTEAPVQSSEIKVPDWLKQ
jgi:DNA-binding transcriptional LysR family regulator